jgi:hypothetical protein
MSRVSSGSTTPANLGGTSEWLASVSADNSSSDASSSDKGSTDKSSDTSSSDTIKTLDDHRTSAILDHPYGSVTLDHLEKQVRRVIEQFYTKADTSETIVSSKLFHISSNLQVDGNSAIAGSENIGGGLTVVGNVSSANINQSLLTTASPTFAGETINGNIVITGTVDGYDVSTLGSYLNQPVLTTSSPTFNIINGTNFVSSAAVTSVSFNTLIKSGFYRVNTNMTNGPTGLAWGQLLVMHADADTICQIYSDFGTGILYTRAGNPSDVGGIGSWTAWVALTSSASVISGSNYTKFPDGTLIQWTSAGGAQTGTWTFPVAFIDTSYGLSYSAFQSIYGNDHLIATSFKNATTTSVGYCNRYELGGDSNYISSSNRFMAIGRWK